MVSRVPTDAEFGQIFNEEFDLMNKKIVNGLLDKFDEYEEEYKDASAIQITVALITFAVNALTPLLAEKGRDYSGVIKRLFILGINKQMDLVRDVNETVSENQV